jgi:hypothetical protein
LPQGARRSSESACAQRSGSVGTWRPSPSSDRLRRSGLKALASADRLLGGGWAAIVQG